jgi:hypothetical protein
VYSAFCNTPEKDVFQLGMEKEENADAPQDKLTHKKDQVLHQA